MPLSESNVLRPSCSQKLCRNLFGSVDHEQLQKDFQSLMRTQLDEAQQKWNFDFETETPLEGAYKWEKVSHLKVPPSQDLHTKENCTGEKSLSSPMHLKMHTKTERPGQMGLEACQTGSPRCSKRKQTSIKDFYSSKRKTTPYKSNP
ncbi:cyclin-dependent kinase inhibitor 1 [Elgaria multicarinata webbii]|uniref:cyclin-dependent kinase inhibitor 1 n=1 Tax=Elgaria multicarinata webbii TaxID=159646 RepID=UPI002FCD0EE4